MCLLCGLFIFKCFNYIKVGEKRIRHHENLYRKTNHVKLINEKNKLRFCYVKKLCDGSYSDCMDFRLFTGAGIS